jgi:hypothetical protein
MEEKKMAKTCNNCGTENTNVTVPYVVHEATVARQERQIKRLWIALIVAISMLFASFALFVWYESQFETISYDYTQDGQGTNIIGDSNEVNNGAEIKGESETQEEE